jgi:hypothetical protein
MGYIHSWVWPFVLEVMVIADINMLWLFQITARYEWLLYMQEKALSNISATPHK